MNFKSINQKSKTQKKCIAFSILLAAVFFAVSYPAQAAITKEISYQGKLTNISNVAVPNGNYDMVIRIYDADSGGNCLWSARGDCVSPTARSVAVANGIFSIMLGETGDNAITLDFNSSYYFGIQVGTDAEMTPRKKVGSAGYAFNTDRLDGLDSATANTASTIVARDGSGNFSAGTITATLAGNAGTVTNGVYTNVANSMTAINPLTTIAESWIGPSATTGIYFKAGNVGIGTTSPSQKLSILGTIESLSGGVKFPDGTIQATAAGSGGSQIVCTKTGWQDGGGGSYDFTFTASDCGGTLPSASYVGVVAKAEICGGLQTFKVLNAGDPNGPGINIYSDPCGDYSFRVVFLIAGGAGGSIQWVSNGSSIFYNSGNVGIGTMSPGSLLDINGTAKMTGFQLGASATTGYVLTTDSSGVGSWQAATGGGLSGGTNNYIPIWTSASTQSSSTIYQTGGNIGIGTTTPGYKLEVAGGINITSGCFSVSGVCLSNSPLTATTSNVVASRAWNAVYQNTSGGPMIVVVTANNSSSGHTMMGNVAAASASLPLSGTNSTTTVSVSFNNGGYAHNMTFIVPPNYYYNVTNDGGTITLNAWQESPLTGGGNLWSLNSSNISYTAGNVGIGTTSPTHLLDINGNLGLSTSSYLNWGATDGASGYGFYDNGGILQYKNSGGSWANIGSGGSSAWSGLTVPSSNLSLAMSTYTTALNWATGTGSNDLFSLTTDATTNGTGALLNIQTGATSSSMLPLRVRAGNTEALMVNANGNIGIGTTSPNEKLTISGVLAMSESADAPDATTGFGKLYAKIGTTAIDIYTKFLLHMDGVVNSFIDSEITQKTVTANGDATQSASQSKFGGKGGYFDGTGDYLSTPDSNDFDFADGDFTVDGWVRVQSLPVDGTGGTITHSGGYTIHTFTSGGTFTPATAGDVEYLVIGGGGGGAGTASSSGSGAGGGAGGYRTGTLGLTAQGYSVVIGAGGAGGAAGGNNGIKGEDSSFDTITAAGGGYGGKGKDQVGGDGGSGGGGGYSDSGSKAGGLGNIPVTSPSQGSNGGAGGVGSPYGAAGGGGADSLGGTGHGGVGGAGKYNNISGYSVAYAGGGGGGCEAAAAGIGGVGGGGAGGRNASGMAGTANTGAGGGGAGGIGAFAGGNGGSGIVIVRYLTGSTLVSQWSSSKGWALRAVNNALTFDYSTDGSATSTKSVSWTPAADTWYHVAVAKGGNNLRFFVDGTQQGATQDMTGVTIYNSSALMTVGATAVPDSYFNGYIDEFRISKGIARWTSDFTPPTQAYGGGQLYYKNSLGDEMALGAGASGAASLWGISGSSAYYNSGNVGIGTTSPGSLLDIAGTARMTGFQLGAATTAGYVLTADANGVGTWQAATGGGLSGGTASYIPLWNGPSSQGLSALYQASGNVGIGTTSPGKTIDVVGTGRITSNLSVGEIASTSNKFEVFATPGTITYGANVLTGGTASAGTYFDATYAPVKAVDGDINTRWAASTGTYPDWWKYDLGSGVAKTVIKLRIAQYQDGSGSGVKNFTLAGSNDDSSWATVYVGLATAGTDKTYQDFTFSNTSAYRYYRITLSDYYGTAQYPSFWEVEMMEGTFANGSSLVVDNSGNVGIGTTSPGSLLDINGTAKMTGFQLGTTTTAGYVLTADANGTGTWQAATGGGLSGGTNNYIPIWTSASTQSSSTIYQTGGNIGIGTTSTSRRLTLSSASVSTNNQMLYLKQATNNYGYSFNIDDSSTGSMFIKGVVDGVESNIMTMNYNSGSVGIGTTSPGSLLDVNGTAKMTGFQLGASTTTGYVLTANSSGVGTWQAATGGGLSGGTNNYIPIWTSASTQSSSIIYQTGGSIGIGTTTPGQLLTVNGTGSVLGNNGVLLLGQNPGAAPYYSNVILKGVSGGYSASIALESTFLSTTQDWYFGSGAGGAGSNFFRIVDLTHSNADRFDINTNGDVYIGGSMNGVSSAGANMVILSGGNVGIGTTGPDYKLDVNGDIRFNYGNAIYSGNNTYKTLIKTGWDSSLSQDYVYFYTAGTLANNANVKLALLRDGSVGIGTTSPGNTKLYVLKGGNVVATGASEAFVLQNSANTTDNSNVLAIGGTTGTAGYWLGDEAGQFQGGLKYDNSNDSLAIWANNTEKVRINNLGNVGIGTTNPGALLDVEKNINGSFWPRFINPNTGTGAFTVLSVGQDASTAYLGVDYLNSGFTADGTNLPNSGLIVAASGATNGLVIRTDAAAPIIFATSGINGEKMRITNGGNVGIGTTAPGAKLETDAGSGIVGQIIKKTAGTDDYLQFIDSGGNKNLYVDSTSQFAFKVLNGPMYFGDFNDPTHALAGFSVPNHQLLSISATTGNVLVGNIANGVPADDLTNSLQVKGGATISGNVGIGTTGPGAPLHVLAATADTPQFRVAYDSSQYTELLHRGRFNIVTTSESTNFYDFRRNGTSDMVIKQGNVGIGTTSPVGIFDVNYSSYANTKLLIHADGSNGSTTFTDSSNAHSVAASGNVQMSTATSKFGGSSVYFDGSYDELLPSAGSDFGFGTADFTVDVWVYPINGGHGSAYARIFETESYPTAGGIALATVNTENPTRMLVHTSDGTNLVYSNSSIPNSTWTHVAVVRSSGTIKLYINGVAQTQTYSTSLNFTAQRLSIGGNMTGSTGGESFYGYMDEFRVSNVARWTSNFTPETAAYDPSGETITKNSGFMVSSNGSVGIGTTNPSTKLYVAGDIYTTSNISALSITDRTAYPKSLNQAYEAVLSMQRLPDGEYSENDSTNQLDHSKLSAFVRAANGERDLSATVSSINEVTKYLLDQIGGIDRPVTIASAIQNQQTQLSALSGITTNLQSSNNIQDEEIQKLNTALALLGTTTQNQTSITNQKINTIQSNLAFNGSQINLLSSKLNLADTLLSQNSQPTQELSFYQFKTESPELSSPLFEQSIESNQFSATYNNPNNFQELNLQLHPENQLDLAEKDQDQTVLVYDVYIENSTDMEDFHTELGNIMDQKELEWNRLNHPNFTPGWNEVRLSFKDGVKTGEVDWQHLNYFRTYFKFANNTKLKFKNIRIETKAKYLPLTQTVNASNLDLWNNADQGMALKSIFTEFAIQVQATEKLDRQVSELDLSLNALEEQMVSLQEQSKAIIDFGLALNLDKVIYKDALSNVNLLGGKITASDIEALNTIKANNVEATNSLKGQNIELGAQVSGTSMIRAGELESAEIFTSKASVGVKLYITALDRLSGRSLYIDQTKIKEGESFRVELDGEALEKDVNFNWLIVK
ncbi:MAG: LamG-like jellyroll fold domain-containing protein [Candidatus Moraniibacteriota bacterium]